MDWALTVNREDLDVGKRSNGIKINNNEMIRGVKGDFRFCGPGVCLHLINTSDLMPSLFYNNRKREWAFLRDTRLIRSV